MTLGQGIVAVQVAVCGPSECTEREARDAAEVGRLLAERGVTVLCGGGTGVMAAVAGGARHVGGLVVGIRPGATAGASPDLSVTVVTNLGEARNAVLVWSADAVIAVGGSWGTLSEVALAVRRGGIPVVTLGGWRVLDRDGRTVAGITEAADAAEAVEMVLRRGV